MPRGGHTPLPRAILISKALSRLLRHAAQQENIPIDRDGWVRCDAVLGWGRLKGMKDDAGGRKGMKDERGKSKGVGFEEVMGVVSGNDKGRFGVRYAGKGVSKEKGQEQGGGEINSNGSGTPTDDKVETETQRAINIFTSGTDTDPKHFYIRANQGHSMKLIEAENLLVPFTLADEASIPQTVVHGTFYGSWEAIVAEGGLRRMGRNHVHFSSGPSLEDVLANLQAEESVRQEQGGRGKGRLSKLMDESKVVSGMRRDAQVLIYVDVRKALKEEERMKWWRSENGVILTEGHGEEGKVGMRYWEKVVEVKEGLGVLWEMGEDGVGRVVKELPELLKGRAVPMGKSRGGGRGARGGRGDGTRDTRRGVGGNLKSNTHA